MDVQPIGPNPSPTGGLEASRASEIINRGLLRATGLPAAAPEKEEPLPQDVADLRPAPVPDAGAPPSPGPEASPPDPETPPGPASPGPAPSPPAPSRDPLGDATQEVNAAGGGSDDRRKVEVGGQGGLLQFDESFHVDPISLTILHTNDLHGFLTPKEGDGSFTEIAARIRQIQGENPNTVYLDAGDSTHGTHATDDARGRAAIEGLNALESEMEKTTASPMFVTLGNHEGMWGSQVLLENIARSRAPVLACNVGDRDGKPLPNTKPWQMATYEDVQGRQLKVAYVGATTPELGEYVERADTPLGRSGEVQVTDPVESVRHAAREARESGADMVVLVSHCGLEVDRKIAQASDDVDVIVGGHSHDAIEEPERVNRALIVQSGSNADNLGKLDIQFDPATRTIQHACHRLISMRGDLPEDLQVARAVEAAANPAQQAAYDRPLGRLEETLPCPEESHGDSKLGNAYTDRLRAAGRSDVALFNLAAFRSRLDRGVVTQRKSDNCMNVPDPVVNFQLTGEQLRGAIEKSLAKKPHGGVYAMSGLQVEYDPMQPPGQRVRSLRLERTEGGRRLEEVDPQREYTVTATDFVASKFVDRQAMREVGSAKELFDTLLADATKRPDVFDVRLDRVRDLSENDPVANQKVGRTILPLVPPRERPETAMGNFVADTVREASAAGVGLVDRKAFGEGVEPGDITRRDLVFAIPHEDRVASVDLSGGQLRGLLEQSLERLEGGLYAVSGLQVRYQREGETGTRLEAVTVQGAPLDDARTYRVGFTAPSPQDMGEENRAEHGLLRDLVLGRVRQSLEKPSILQVPTDRLVGD